MSQSEREGAYPRAEVGGPDDDGTPGRFPRLRAALSTLQDTSTQTVETVVRSASLQTTGGQVEDVDPPDDIDQYVELYYEIGFIRSNINEFVDDVTAPGVRVVVDDEENPNAEAVEDYFMGGDNAPEGAPEGGFLSECFVFDEKRQPFGKGLEISTRDRWVRGTVLVEYVKADPEDDESIISGFRFIRPETVSARTYENTNELIAPDDLEAADAKTPRNEAAAFVQFDEQSILGRRTGRDPFSDSETSIPLSQNDVLKLELDQDIGGEDPESGVFGESILRPVATDAEEYRSMKRSLVKAVQGKAWGLWTAQMNDHVIDLGDEKVLVEWGEEDIQNTESEIEDLGPGSTLTTDAEIELERHDGDVPDLEWALRHYARDIVDPLPAPFYKHAFADDINQFVTDDQQEDYQERIQSERQTQAAQWEQAFREVCRRHPELDPAGLAVEIAPEEDASPVRTLDETEIEKIKTFADALDKLSGSSDPVAIFGEETVRELVAMLPEAEGVQDALSLEDVVEDRETFDRLVDTEAD